MKQTTIQFEKRSYNRVTIQRLQQVVDLVGEGHKLNYALHAVGLKGGMGTYLVDAKILVRLNGTTVIVAKPKLERKDYYRVMDLQKRYHKTKNERRKSLTGYNQLPKADTDSLGLVNMPKRTYKPRIKKEPALPWWKRFLLYLLNN